MDNNPDVSALMNGLLRQMRLSSTLPMQTPMMALPAGGRK
jgi:hypothetical protein